MLTVGLTEAKRRFEELVERAVRGERIRITKYGKLKAEIVRAPANRRKPSVSEKAGKHSMEIAELEQQSVPFMENRVREDLGLL